MLKQGLEKIQKFTVTSQLTAKAMGSGTLDVLATPAMIAFMENTAMNCVAPFLEEGQGTVGSLIEVSHASPTPLGLEVTCEAVLEEVEGKKLTFAVKATDCKGTIGEGRHVRFIIDEERFVKKAQAKSEQ